MAPPCISPVRSLKQQQRDRVDAEQQKARAMPPPQKCQRRRRLAPTDCRKGRGMRRHRSRTHGRSVGAMAEAGMKRSLIGVPCSMCNHLIARCTCIHIASPLWESRPPATAIVTASSSIVAECCCRLSTSFSPFYPFNVHVLPSHRISWVVSENHRVHASHSHWTGIGVAGGSELVIQVISVCSVLLVLGMARSVPLSFLLM